MPLADYPLGLEHPALKSRLGLSFYSMMDAKSFPLARPVSVIYSLVLGVLSSSVWAIDGGNDVYITVPSGEDLGWKTFEIISGADALGSRAEEGFVWTSKHDDWDGLGAYRHDPDTLRVFINHEAGSNSTFSRVDVDLMNLRAWIASGTANNTNSNQVAPPGEIVRAMSRGWLSLGSGSNPIKNPCSGNVWMADTFGAGRGFADTLYLTGEETFDTTGEFWVMDAATRTIYECPDLGSGSWENACIIDTGRTDTVALLLGEDAGSNAIGSAPLQLYVGMKNSGGNFLERNGLSGGTVYYWDPVGVDTNGTIGGIFSGGNGTAVSGTWVTSRVDSALFSKLEDVHTNVRPASPGYGVEAVFASQGQGVFTVDFSGVDFDSGDLGANRNSEVVLLFQAGTQEGANDFSGMDNLVWSADGSIYVTEDDGEGDVWKIDVDSLRSSYLASDFTPDGAQVFDILDADFVSESSGIIDISEHVGYEPGGVFLVAGQSSTLSRNQVAMVVVPGAMVRNYFVGYRVGTGGSLTGNSNQTMDVGGDTSAVTAIAGAGYGFIGWSDGVATATRTDLNVMTDLDVTANFEVVNGYLAWVSGYPSLTGVNADPDADFDQDGLSNKWEYAVNLNPTISDYQRLIPGTGTAGLPLVEIRTFGSEERLVIEYVRRVGNSGLSYIPQFSSALLSDGWQAGGNETVVSIDASWERVVQENSVNVSPTGGYFSRLALNLTMP